MTVTTWFSADFHLDHKNILTLCHRPFGSIEEMNEVLIENWNRNVAPHDEAYILGDGCFGPRSHAERQIAALNGHLHWIRGNHDKTLDALASDLFVSYDSYKEIRRGDHKVILSHYPFMTWNGAHRGSWHLHGHCHGSLPETGQPRLDVGVDPHDFRPISFEEIEVIMADREFTPVDHHVGY